MVVSPDLRDAGPAPRAHYWWRKMLEPDQPLAEKGESTLEYTERLRCLAINDGRLTEDWAGAPRVESEALDPKTLALVRLAALVAVGGAVPSYGAQADAALSAGATAAEIVEVLIGVVPVVGLPRVVAAAPQLAMALGYDADDALEPQSGE